MVGKLLASKMDVFWFMWLSDLRLCVDRTVILFTQKPKCCKVIQRVQKVAEKGIAGVIIPAVIIRVELQQAE